MQSLTLWHWIVVFTIILILFGGRGKIMRLASEFRDQFREALRDTEMENLEKKMDEMVREAQFENPHYKPWRDTSNVMWDLLPWMIIGTLVVLIAATAWEKFA